MLLTTVIFGLLIIASIGLNLYFANKLLKAYTVIEENQIFINNIGVKIQNTYKQLKSIDDMQMFEKDDDVGFVFTNMLELIETLNKNYDDKK
jgi:hypothetical protein